MSIFRLLAVLLIFVATNASAATIELMQGGACFARLSGQIQDGDTAAFAKLEQANPREGNGDELFRNLLCLDSPGGSLTEGIELAKYLSDNRIGTRIEANASCLSACSIAFMAGTLGGNEEITGIDRQMDVFGTLGFHRPSISLNTDKQFSDKAIVKSFDLALEATLNFVQLANYRQHLSPDVMVKSDLIEAMFSHRGEDFFYIDTVDKAARWDIQITGYDAPRQIGLAEAWNVCENMGHWPATRNNISFQPYTGFDPNENVRIATRNEFGLVYAVRGSGDGLVSHACLVQMANDQGYTYLSGCGQNEAVGTTFGSENCNEGDPFGFAGLTDLAVFPPDLPLRALPTAARALNSRTPPTPESLRADGITNLRKGCNVYGRPTYVANVQNFVNLRSGQGFDQPVVAELPLDQQLQGVEGPLFLGDPAETAKCDQACYLAGSPDMTPGALRALAQCYEENMMWYGVETSSGLSGYVSGKYLRY